MYENFGFTDNIFNTKPLDVCQEDLGKFTGRVQDIKNFVVNISSTDSAFTLVTGHRGVGKSSFVNVMEYATSFDKEFLKQCINVSIPDLIPCYYKIQLEPDESVKSVLSKSLSSLLFSVKHFASEKKNNKKIPKRIQELVKWVSEINISETRSSQLNMMGWGGGFSRTRRYRSLSDFPTNVLEDMIKQTVEIVIKNFKVKGIFLNINNIDILEEKKTCDLFNQLRDYLFNIKGLWCVVIGPPGLYSSLSQQAARVAEVVSGQETLLNPLSEEDVITILNIRRKMYSRNPRRPAPLPIEDDFVREIYKHSEGEIRQVLNACDKTLRSGFKENPHIRSIPKLSGKRLLRSVLEEQLSLHSLKPKTREIIQKIMEKGSFRPKEYRDLKLKSAVDFTNRAKPLLERSFLKKEVRGNTANYKVAGIIQLAKYAGVSI